ncbi:MAG: beta-lactamase family protein [Acidobacteria bacterium]|nr:beta-lactamase family protein [Acidobacteriota bacterium]
MTDRARRVISIPLTATGHRLCALLLFVVPLVGAAPPNASAQSTSAPATAPAPLRYAEAIEEARALVQTDIAERGYPGIAIAVSVNGETIWSEGFGYANLEHRVPMLPSVKFRVGSISKSMTAAAVAKLVEEGRLDVDLPIQQYVPSFPEKAYPITTRQLGGHLGGIRHYEGDENFIRDPYPTVLDGLTIFADDPLLHEPGTRYSYTSHGFNLISAVVEGAAKQPFLDMMRESVFRPLGMRDTVADFVTPIIPGRTSYYVRDAEGHVVNAPFVNNSYKWAGGGFLSTTEDVLTFANAHLDDKFLSEESRKLLFTEQRTRDGEGVGYGFGWFVRTRDDGRRLLSHSGGSVGGTSLMVMEPSTRVVVVGLINLTRADNSVVTEVLDLFIDAVAAAR